MPRFTHGWALSVTLLVLGGVVGCEEEETPPEVVAARQDGVVLSEGGGRGVMVPYGQDIEFAGVRADDRVVMIRSFAPDACVGPDTILIDESPPGFAWGITALLPLARFAPGERFVFKDLSAWVEASGNFPDEPLADWSDLPSYDCTGGENELATIEILEVAEDGASARVKIGNACATDWGKYVMESGATPPPAVLHRLDGEYEIELCEPSETPAAG